MGEGRFPSESTIELAVGLGALVFPFPLLGRAANADALRSRSNRVAWRDLRVDLRVDLMVGLKAVIGEQKGRC
jgi:hypothetical protein